MGENDISCLRNALFEDIAETSTIHSKTMPNISSHLFLYKIILISKKVVSHQFYKHSVS